VAVLVNPAEAAITETTVRDVQAAARAMGLQIRIVNASNSREIVAAFAMLAAERPDAIFVGPGSFMVSRRVQLAHLATRHAIPAVYPGRIFADVGGLMSYGPSLTDAYRQVGVYVGRILKGAKPSDLPVLQPSKFELIINAETARMLGLTVPDKLLVAADVVIE
jgi:putative ABC transport system substrate-binding protein